MLRLLFICFSLLVVPSFSLKVSSGPQIDPVIVLLPWSPPELSEQRVVFTLRAFGGCFEWTSQRPDLIEVTSLPGPNECSTEAVVSQRAALPIQDKAWVFARDRETQTELRCEVHVAPLSSIVIDTPTRSIGVEAVETLSLRGFDKLGNVFSSLERLWFKWSSSDTGNSSSCWCIILFSFRRFIFRVSRLRCISIVSVSSPRSTPGRST